MEDELLSLLEARQGHFRFESGHHGNLWLDLDRLFLRASQVQRFMAELARRLAPYPVAAVCGPLVGGALIAHNIAAQLDLEFYFTERLQPPRPDLLYSVQYRIPAALRQQVRGKDVAVVDDVINAGSAVAATLADLRACGARGVVIGALLVLGPAAPRSFQESGLPLEAIGHLASDLWVPAACPLCASGQPIDPTPGDRS